MKILKFGGSSVATADRIRTVVEIVREARRNDRLAVVVSALGGVTDVLLDAAHMAASRDEAYKDKLTEIETRHFETLAELTSPADRAPVHDDIVEAFRDIGDLLHGTFLLREASPRIRDSIASYGERLSAHVVAAAARHAGLDAEPCDARRLIVTGPEFGAAQVDSKVSYARIREHFGRQDLPLQIVTGYIGATPEGQTTTLGRGGSDCTASLLGAALEASDVELWTDVNGVMSADPRLVPAAAPIERLSYDELMELSHFGAKVVHPPSVHPARRQGTRLWIKNTLQPDFPGTVVTDEAEARGKRPIRGIASIPRVALLRLEGDGMVGVPGIAMRLFGAVAREKVSVILISQASSEHSICLALTSEDVPAAARSIEEEFTLERRVGLIDPLVVEDEMAVIAAVGAGMRARVGIAGKLFAVLGSHGVNVRAISQGSSELNISLVVEARDEARAVNAIHDALLFPGRKVVELCLIGTGRVGGTLLEQIAEQQKALATKRGMKVRLAVVGGRSRVLTDPAGLDPATAPQRLRAEGEPYDLGELVTSLVEDRQPKTVFVDCTASAEVTRCYDRLLAAGIDVVTANKLRLAGPGADYESLKRARPGRLFFETTVGAGLPVIGTLEYLLSTGDRVRRIEGVLSGTLGFLADQLGAGRSFSETVRRAYDLGYTEPDPREDLSGRDVARKLLILGRLVGCEMEPEDVEVEPLLPDSSWNGLEMEDFWQRLGELDASFAERQAAASREGARLCYLARLDDCGARVSLEAVDAAHPCAGLRGTDNLIAVYSDRYRETPLVVRGPGAGPEVTAAGVFGDILRSVAEI